MFICINNDNISKRGYIMINFVVLSNVIVLKIIPKCSLQVILMKKSI